MVCLGNMCMATLHKGDIDDIIIIIIIIITDKQNKYQELANEICVMWKQNAAKVIPIAITSTGIIPKSPSQSLKKLNHLTPNCHYMGRTAQLTSRCFILYIYSTNIRTEYF